MIRPLWITNWLKAAALLYAFLPCQSSKCLAYLNSNMEISEARAAWLPSFPTIPNPIEASWIIPTSLPPSPIPATIDPVKVFTLSVINAFWVGKHRQHITAGAFLATSKNNEELFEFRILVRAGPSTRRTCSAGSYSINLVLSN